MRAVGILVENLDLLDDMVDAVVITLLHNDMRRILEGNLGRL